MPQPTMTPVTSSNIQSVGHDGKDLYVTFKSTGTYVYRGCPADVHKAMISAPSVGSFFSSKVKNAYPYERI